MTIVCVDNTPIMLQSLKEIADQAYPHADVKTFLSTASALEHAEVVLATFEVVIHVFCQSALQVRPNLFTQQLVYLVEIIFLLFHLSLFFMVGSLNLHCAHTSIAAHP